MNQTDYKLLETMNLKTDVIAINQCGTNKVEEILYNERKVKIYSLKEKGIGLSRNTALDRADGEICLFADDDIVYEDNYYQIIQKAFYENPKADILVFNVPIVIGIEYAFSPFFIQSVKNKTSSPEP